jgi:tRNA(Leu) C34 or U34 (ribose-2'-O)-methylase TrmL
MDSDADPIHYRYNKDRLKAAVNSREGYTLDVHKSISEGIEFVKAAAVLVEEHNLGDKLVDELEGLVERLVSSQCELETHQQALKKLNPAIDAIDAEKLQDDDQWMPAQVLTQLTEQDEKKNNAAKEKKINAFRRAVWAKVHPTEPYPEDDVDEADIVMVGQESQREYICPLTGALLENPVKSTSCGHRFSKDAITQYINTKMRQYGNRGQNRIKCPLSGCNNMISMDMLEADVEASFWVRRQKNLSAETNSTSESNLMDFTQA